MKKKFLSLLSVLAISSLALIGCSGEGDENVLKVGASPEPHAGMLEHISSDLEAEGIKLEIVEFSDYVAPNLSLNDAELDANFFQHQPYLENFVAERGVSLVSLGAVHIEPMGLYSKTVTSLDEIPEGATVSIPNDPTNGARALLLLERNGLITLDESAGFNATERDIIDNPKNISIQPLEAAQLPRTLDDVDASVINGNFALEAGLVPAEDAIVIEEKDSPYANIVAIRAGDEENEKLLKLMEALHSDKMRDYINENYDGGVIPSF